MFLRFQIITVTVILYISPLVIGALQQRRNDAHRERSSSALYLLQRLQPGNSPVNMNKTARGQHTTTDLYQCPAPRDMGCDTYVSWRYLGRDVFPMFVREIKCTGSCLDGFYSCRKQTFPMPILKLRPTTSNITMPDLFLHTSLRSRWTAGVVDVSVACLCSV